MPKQISKVYQCSDEDFIKIIKNVYTYSDALRALGLGPSGGSSTDILKRRISELNCSTDHFGKQTVSSNIRYKIEEILIKNSSYSNIASLKRRLISEGILEYKCIQCGNIGKWNDKPLSLQLEHINGINNDNRKENLCFLCPNCHSQTDTYAGRNISVKS